MKIPVANVDYKLNLPKPHLSYSQIDCYLKCPAQYRAKYVDGIKSKTTAAMFEGGCLGAALEALGRRIIKGTEPCTLDWTTKEYAKVLRKTSSEVDDWGDETPDSLKGRAEFFLNTFFRDGHAEQLKPLAVEEEQTIEIAGVPVVIIPDVIERNYIIDYKTVKSTRFLNVEKSLQLSLYAHAHQKERVGFMVFLKEGKKPIDLLVGTRDLKQTRHVLELVVSSVAQAISMGSFPVCDPSTNFLCSSAFCPVWNSCMGAVA